METNSELRFCAAAAAVVSLLEFGDELDKASKLTLGWIIFEVICINDLKMKNLFAICKENWPSWSLAFLLLSRGRWRSSWKHKCRIFWGIENDTFLGNKCDTFQRIECDTFLFRCWGWRTCASLISFWLIHHWVNLHRLKRNLPPPSFALPDMTRCDNIGYEHRNSSSSPPDQGCILDDSEWKGYWLRLFHFDWIVNEREYLPPPTPPPLHLLSPSNRPLLNITTVQNLMSPCQEERNNFVFGQNKTWCLSSTSS